MATQSRAVAILVGNIVPQVFATLFSLARVYSRAYILRTWAIDDWLIVFSWFCGLACTILSCVATKYGAGHHQANVSIAAAQINIKIGFITLFFYHSVLASTKISICLFYLRIFHPERRSRYLIYACIATLVITFIAFTFFNIFQCSPIAAYWDFGLKAAGGHCTDPIPAFYAAGIYNILSEVFLIAIILPRVLVLKITRRQKTALVTVVSVGWLVAIASIIRVVRISKLLHEEDKTWASYDTTIWTAVEIDVGIVCACAPAIKPLLNQLIPRFMGTLTPNSSGWNRYGRKGTYDHRLSTRKGNVLGSGIEMGSKRVQRITSETDLTGHGKNEFSEVRIKGGAESTDAESLEEVRGGDDGTIMRTTSVLVTTGYDDK
ncbi:hypothetical protein BU16DRAFT_535249 [Lophium mytilinum]|uniref:Rhodopsin domain-containing protein n=1 Tax=Lophium mytilinum TaxID=390894 RepID=A0A6A6RB47_9PEZI|nr:hypothetical protein BU16DRAFT_535249 [Lophium mytilinum]